MLSSGVITRISRPLVVVRLGLIANRTVAHEARLTPKSKLEEEYGGHNEQVKLVANQDEEKKYFEVASWPHPGYTMDQMEKIGPSHREAESMSDKIAWAGIRFLRSSFDFFTGYPHPPKGQENNPKYIMSEKKWLKRFLFLESIAGVPGMCGGMIRHLQSLRILRRDRAWIETLLEEAYNERMHLMTFMKLTRPGWFMRLMLLAGQGIFMNMFFICYLFSPRTCHRFVGYLEEEAIKTFSRCIDDIDSGRLNEWNYKPAPQFAKYYWHMNNNATMRDLIEYVRADEGKHREVNHTLANIQQTERNPFVLEIDTNNPQPKKDLSQYRPNGWEAKDIFAKK